jgi:hypothetical protein
MFEEFPVGVRNEVFKDGVDAAEVTEAIFRGWPSLEFRSVKILSNEILLLARFFLTYSGICGLSTRTSWPIVTVRHIPTIITKVVIVIHYELIYFS